MILFVRILALINNRIINQKLSNLLFNNEIGLLSNLYGKYQIFSRNLKFP